MSLEDFPEGRILGRLQMIIVKAARLHFDLHIYTFCSAQCLVSSNRFLSTQCPNLHIPCHHCSPRLFDRIMPLLLSCPAINALFPRTESAHPQSDIVTAEQWTETCLVSQPNVLPKTTRSRMNVSSFGGRDPHGVPEFVGGNIFK